MGSVPYVVIFWRWKITVSADAIRIRAVIFWRWNITRFVGRRKPVATGSGNELQ
jgi:hypothetical protein